MNNLDKNLYTKHELKFNKNGKFKILMMSDIQETLNYDTRTLECMDKLIEKTQPDFIILGGDNCDGTILKTEEELRKYLEIFTQPMEKRKIPWAHIFGNHDHDIKINDITKTKIYENFKYCISKHTENIYGTTNFVLPIKNSKSDNIAFNIWGLDSNNEIRHSNIDIDKNIKLMNMPSMSDKWDIVHFEQLMWYWNSSKEIEDYCGNIINGILFMHISPWEFQYIVDNPIVTQCTGSTKEIMKIGMFNFGLFSTILQRKDIICIACGHSHNDCFEGTFCNVKMCLDACAGYSPYGTDDLRGGRIFEINENDTNDIKTYMVHYKDLK